MAGGVVCRRHPRESLSQLDRRAEHPVREASPGSKVNITLLPTNNDQFSAKLQAAFTSGNVPDVMLIYSGGYTTPYIPSLLQLNPYIDASPGMYDSISNWDLSCGDLNCQGGSGPIYGVPIDFGSYGLFYNKDSAQAGRAVRAAQDL